MPFGNNKPILPGATIGILGGGQLGRMTAMAARALGYRIQVLDPDPSCPARFTVDSCFAASFDDVDSTANLARGCDVVTIEIEKIALPSMRAAEKYAPVRPGSDVLEIIQHRAKQKDWLAAHGAPVGPYLVVNSAAELEKAAHELIGSSENPNTSGVHGTPGQAKAQTSGAPNGTAEAVPLQNKTTAGECFVKTAEGGYDGRGQAVLHSPTDAHKAWLYLSALVCVCEKALDIESEISVMVARRPSSADSVGAGETVVFPVAFNHHTDRILDWSVIPAPIPDALATKAQSVAKDIAEKIGICGLLCVEMFVLKDGTLLVNELAPRPHNSYHASERACATSQFEQCVRAVCDLPLGSVEIQKPAAIANLLGDVWLANAKPNFSAALAVPGVRLHLYDKQVPKAGRKMGHISAVGATPEEAVERVQRARKAL